MNIVRMVCSKCLTKGKNLNLQERVKHFETCRHPDCVRRMAWYEQIAKYVEENLQKERK